MSKLTLTPIKFDAQYPDGVLEIDGMAFDWNGKKFAVHQVRELYRWPTSTLSVSHVDTGFSIGSCGNTKDYMKAAKAAIAKLDALGVDKVNAALDKARALDVPTTRLTA